MFFYLHQSLFESEYLCHYLNKKKKKCIIAITALKKNISYLDIDK